MELLDATLSKNGPLVIPGDPENSLLVWKLEGQDSAGRPIFGDQMPLGRTPLTAAEIDAIKRWIGEGALLSTAPPARRRSWPLFRQIASVWRSPSLSRSILLLLAFRKTTLYRVREHP